MKDKKLIIMSLSAILILIIACSAYFFKKPEEKEPENYSKEALQFKEEYESLNDTIRESDGAKYNNVTIPKDNPIKYVNCKEALEVLKDETAILYVGANWCPWCRNAVPVLFDVAKERNIKTIYYLNLDNEKDEFKIENSKLVKTKEGTEDYYALLEFLKDDLKDYILTDSNGKKYDTKEKRIYMPFVIAAKNGKVEGTHNGTISLNEDQTKYSSLTKEQEQELKTKYNDLFSTIYTSGTCDEGCD